MKTLQKVIAEQPASSCRKIANRFAELVAEQMTTRKPSKERNITQARLAKKMAS